MGWEPTSWKFADGDARGVIDLRHSGKYHWHVWQVGPWGRSARGKAPTLDRARCDAETAAARLRAK